MAKNSTRKYFIIGSILWTCVIAGLSLLPSSEIPKGFRFPHIDKVVHFIMFLVYGIVVTGAFDHNKKTFFRFLLIFMCLFSVGLIMELLQSYIPGRQADFYDLISNGLGAFIGITNYLVIKNKFLSR